MDESMRKFFQDWDSYLEETKKLNRGEWSSGGEKKLTFDISELSMKHQVRGDKFRGEKKPVSHLTYEFTCTGKHPGYIIIGKMPDDDWPDIQISDEKCAIGYIKFYENDTDFKDFYLVIVLSKTAFEDLSRLILSFQGNMRLTVNIQRELTDSESEKIFVTGYEISKHKLMANKDSA
jgi:hypothetical protein